MLSIHQSENSLCSRKHCWALSDLLSAERDVVLKVKEGCGKGTHFKIYIVKSDLKIHTNVVSECSMNTLHTQL